MARRLCYAKSGKPVEAPSIETWGYHIFLSHVVSYAFWECNYTVAITLPQPADDGIAFSLCHTRRIVRAASQWGTAQDQMRVIKQRLLEMIPDLRIFLEYAHWRLTQEQRAATNAKHLCPSFAPLLAVSTT